MRIRPIAICNAKSCNQITKAQLTANSIAFSNGMNKWYEHSLPSPIFSISDSAESGIEGAFFSSSSRSVSVWSAFTTSLYIHLNDLPTVSLDQTTGDGFEGGR